MARRTKKDALATRENIIDCAEALFARQGVTHTTLQDIADKAGVTRGAIYWHFEDKIAVFNALMSRVNTPLESAVHRMVGMSDSQDALADLKASAMMIFRLSETDVRARRAFEIATMKVEYVNEMKPVQDRGVEITARWMMGAEKLIRAAIRRGQARPDTKPREIALGVMAITDGLLRAWLLSPDSFDLSATGGAIIDTFVGQLRLTGDGRSASA